MDEEESKQKEKWRAETEIKRKGKEGFHRKPSGTSLSSKKFRRGDKAL